VFASSTIGNPYLFTGRRYDAETSWYHYRTRYLDPAAGRFTTRDVIGIWGDPWELGNGYAYVGNRPLTWLDPLGLACDKENEQDDDPCKKVNWNQPNPGGGKTVVLGTVRCDGKGNAVLCINPAFKGHENDPGSRANYGATFLHEGFHALHAQLANVCKGVLSGEDPRWRPGEQDSSELIAYTISYIFLKATREKACEGAHNVAACLAQVDRWIAGEAANLQNYIKKFLNR
jgi:RHS repeat-associated protein